ncbi:MAG TPA: hypothetical protein VFO34_14540 [Candidatus Acidoferrales bacterium]|nr:hypothetical protein [Candidatus Acidoferrales bacterium]
MNRRRIIAFSAFSFAFLTLTSLAAHAQTDPSAFQALRWRSIGPERGGRVTAVAGLPGDRLTYYMGATGGGVWKTADAGINWTPISDRYFKTGSVGSIAVAESDPNIVYVGMGEACLRANISHGDGVYKSTDAGRTWASVGLKDSSQIGKVWVDPKNADLVYVAAIGHPYGPNEERGVFRSNDGGKTWKKILYVNDKTGAADLSVDPRDTKIMYATTWQVLRQPWDIYEFGPGSGIYKTTDGGDTWTPLKEGLPKSDMGKIGIAVSPADSNRIYATIGGDEGGIFRSDDAGKSWKLLNGSFEMHSRQYYYGHIFADPQQVDTVYTFTSKDFYKSTDGGKSWGRIQTPHGDYHSLWIDPHDNQRMVNGNDGGATVTFDGGRSWSAEMNQPTAQFYTVRADNDVPYHVYGAQQDNTTVSIASQASGGRGGGANFAEVGGGESGYVVPDPTNPNIIYAGAYWGLLTRFDRRTGIAQNITVWPDLPGGRTGIETKYRFQWTFPVAISSADPSAIYAGGNVVFKSTDQGRSWKPISPDLTRHDSQKESGGRLEDIYCTVFTIAPSAADKNVIWAGSDDGFIHVTRNGGQQWSNVTPQQIQPWTRVNVIEASPRDPATAYAAVNRYQLDDFHPYIYRTHDYGKTWTLAVNGIAPDTFVRSVRQDPARPSVLYAATESGVYISFDDGDHWQSLQLNLPIVPVTDLTIHDGDLIASTQGRAFWVLDDITSIEQGLASASAGTHLYKPRDAYRGRGGRGFAGGGGGPSGVIVEYSLAAAPQQPVTLEFQDAAGKMIKSFTSVARAAAQQTAGRPGRGQGGGAAIVSTQPGMNRFQWDMRYPDAAGIDGGTFFLGGSLRGPEAIPGQYTVKLTVDGQSFTENFEIKKDPSLATTAEDYRKQLELLLAVRDKLSATNEAINQIHHVQQQIESASQKAGTNGGVKDSSAKLSGELNDIVLKLYEPRFTGFDDQTLIYPLKLNNRIAALASAASGDFAPTQQEQEVFTTLSAELDQALGALKKAIDVDLRAFNDKLKGAGLPEVSASPSRASSNPE